MHTTAHAEMSRERDRAPRKCTAPVNAQAQSMCKLAESICMLDRGHCLVCCIEPWPSVGNNPSAVACQPERARDRELRWQFSAVAGLPASRSGRIPSTVRCARGRFSALHRHHWHLLLRRRAALAIICGRSKAFVASWKDSDYSAPCAWEDSPPSSGIIGIVCGERELRWQLSAVAR